MGNILNVDFSFQDVATVATGLKVLLDLNPENDDDMTRICVAGWTILSLAGPVTTRGPYVLKLMGIALSEDQAAGKRTIKLEVKIDDRLYHLRLTED